MAYQHPIYVFGGTHGNEWTGVLAVTKYGEALQQKYPHLHLHFVLANPEAHEINMRFKDEDLNRAFQYLHEGRPGSYEHQRAHELKSMIDRGPCFVIDLHTTTSNMGKTLILTDYDPLNLYVSAKVTEAMHDARIIGSPDPAKKYLASQSRHSLMIEVGPVPNGTINGKVLEGTVGLLDTILFHLNSLPRTLSGEVDLYLETQDVKYPVDGKNEIKAYIHSHFQDQDFVAMKGLITPFRSFSGEDIAMELSEEMYPIFINEAAYYPQQLAFTLCRKIKMKF